MPLLSATAVYGALFPFSEISAGGNHDLNLLPASLRRALHTSEPITLNALRLAKHAKHIPRHALIPYLPLSLYVPRAGFLWAGADEDDDAGVFFSDPFLKWYPWALEEPPSPTDEELDTDQLDFVRSHVWPLALVYVRSRLDRRYLGVTNQKIHVDRPDNEISKGKDEDPFKRIELSMHDRPSAATVWVLKYDPHADAGFRLLNPDSDCYLATTFRALGDADVELRDGASYGASCTRGASGSASTFWAIEGASPPSQAPRNRMCGIVRTGGLIREHR